MSFDYVFTTNFGWIMHLILEVCIFSVSLDCGMIEGILTFGPAECMHA